MANVFGIVLAGGEGKRLAPLTADRAKPAVAFGGNYRLIDFAVSNLVNAGFRRIVVLTQYKGHSLDRHIAQTWDLSPLLGNYVTPVSSTSTTSSGRSSTGTTRRCPRSSCSTRTGAAARRWTRWSAPGL